MSNVLRNAWAALLVLTACAAAACSDTNSNDDACEGPNPAVDACAQDSECASGQRCIETGECRGSSCSCGADGLWACTFDCVPRHECVTPRACAGPNPADRQCRRDTDCASGETCNLHECTSSGCFCDERSGAWVCSDDCRPACGAPPVCGVDPSKDGCAGDEDCPAGETCKVSAADACRPSSCRCDEATQAWGCSKDCQPYHACAP